MTGEEEREFILKILAETIPLSVMKNPAAIFESAIAAVKCISIEECSKLLSVKPATVLEYIKSGHLKAVQPNGKRYFVTYQNLYKFLNDSTGENKRWTAKKNKKL